MCQHFSIGIRRTTLTVSFDHFFFFLWSQPRSFSFFSSFLLPSNGWELDGSHHTHTHTLNSLAHTNDGTVSDFIAIFHDNTIDSILDLSSLNRAATNDNKADEISYFGRFVCVSLVVYACIGGGCLYKINWFSRWILQFHCESFHIFPQHRAQKWTRAEDMCAKYLYMCLSSVVVCVFVFDGWQLLSNKKKWQVFFLWEWRID